MQEMKKNECHDRSGSILIGSSDWPRSKIGANAESGTLQLDNDGS